jgi:thiosulfate/3-mercaptopyruvate sulfurtransferase
MRAFFIRQRERAGAGRGRILSRTMLVGTEWLAERLDDPNLVVVDLRWREDASGRARFEAGHIPGARFVDWTTDIVDRGHRFAFMLAPPDIFAATMERLGVSDDSVVVAYADDRGSGPHRLWWACRVYGHDNVLVLDGGLEKWVGEGRPVSTEAATSGAGRWTALPANGLVATRDDVADARSETGIVVLDSRPPEQFRGEMVWFETGPIAADADGIARTPRGDLRAGRVPWAVSVPAGTLYRPDFTMKSGDELEAVLRTTGALDAPRVVTYCGVGISASALLFALTAVGVEDASLYDASWDEWGRDPSLPVARG